MVQKTLSVLLVVVMATLVTSQSPMKSLEAANGAYKLDWAVLKDPEGKASLQCFVHVKGAKGWIAIGFSHEGSGMTNADLAIAFRINDTSLEVGDYWSAGVRAPVKDTKQSFTEASAMRDVGTDTSTMSFIRPLDTGDKEQDVVIDLNGMHVLWAYSEKAVPNDEGYHETTRGYFPGKVVFGEPTSSVVEPTSTDKAAAGDSGSQKSGAASPQASIAVLITAFLYSVSKY